jgi:phage shock protein A
MRGRAVPNIFKRISDVITTNIHDILDRVEDPERMIKQVIREMEDNVAQAWKDIIEVSVSEKRLQEDLQHHARQSQEWLQRVEEAIQAGRKDVARTAVRHKKEHDDMIQTFEPAWEAAKKTAERLKTQLLAVQAKLGEAKHIQTVLVARQRAALAQQNMEGTLAKLHGFSSSAISPQVQNTFSQAVEKIKVMETRAKVMVEMANIHSWPTQDLLAEERDRVIENELAEIETKVKERLLSQQEQSLTSEPRHGSSKNRSHEENE